MGTPWLESFPIGPQGAVLWPTSFHLSLATKNVQVSDSCWAGKRPSPTTPEEKQEADSADVGAPDSSVLARGKPSIKLDA